MKYFALSLLLACAVAFGQTASLPTNVYAGGVSFNNAASPKLAGTGLYARLVNDGTGTYAFSVFDALPTSYKPFTVTSNVGAGVAQHLFNIGKIPLYAPVSTGISWTGSNTGWMWNGGVMAAVKVKNNWHVYPNVRFLRSNVSNGSGYQVTAGVLIGFQK